MDEGNFERSSASDSAQTSERAPLSRRENEALRQLARSLFVDDPRFVTRFEAGFRAVDPKRRRPPFSFWRRRR